jgi:hypothetical protein
MISADRLDVRGKGEAPETEPGDALGTSRGDMANIRSSLSGEVNSIVVVVVVVEPSPSWEW